MRISKSVVLVLALCGCGLLGKKGGGEDAGAVTGEVPGAIDAEAVATPPGTPIGKNAPAVARFATEAPANEPKMLGQAASPRTSPGAGTVVTQLKTGTVVTRIATNAGQSLIVFPDPNVPTDNLMGWVPDSAFSAVVVPKPATTTTTDGGTVAVVDAGAPAVVDAGAPAVADAGAAEKKQPTCPKAGSTPVLLSTTSNAWSCRKNCTADKDCTKGTKKCETFKVYLPPAGSPTSVKTCHDDQ